MYPVGDFRVVSRTNLLAIVLGNFVDTQVKKSYSATEGDPRVGSEIVFVFCIKAKIGLLPKYVWSKT